MQTLAEIICGVMYARKGRAVSDLVCTRQNVHVKLTGLLGVDIADMKRKHFSNYQETTDRLTEGRFTTFEIEIDDSEVIEYQEFDEQDEFDING